MDAELSHGCQHLTQDFFVTRILGGEVPHRRPKIPKAVGLDTYMDAVHHG
jgi:hypothetical protein